MPYSEVTEPKPLGAHDDAEARPPSDPRSNQASARSAQPAKAAGPPPGRVSEPDWWIAEPGSRRRIEQDALDAAGLAWRNVPADAVGGLFSFDVDVEGPTGPVTLRAVYPRLFPYFQPQVRSEDLGLAHHWEPRSGNVCLLGPGARGWHSDDTLADLLLVQWPRVLAANTGNGRAPDGSLLETDQAEPWTAYLKFEPGAVAVVDSAAEPPPSLHYGTAVWHIDRADPLNAVLVGLRDDEGRPVFDGTPVQSLGGTRAIDGLWVRIDSVPNMPDARSLWAAAAKARPGLEQEGWARHPSEPQLRGKAAALGKQIQLVLIRTPEETARRELGEGWTALLRTRAGHNKPAGRPRVVKISYAGWNDLYLRAPGVRAMKDKTIVVVGAGGLGSEVILGLAKLAPAGLVLVDGDTIDMGTAVRTTAAYRFAGWPKVLALAQMIVETQPYTKVESIPLKLGHAHSDEQTEKLHGQFVEALGRADLVIDCTADLGVQNLLASTLRAAGRPYLQAEATAGVWGALIALHLAEADQCWGCLQLHLADGADGALPPPPSSGNVDVATPGCLEPTYPGAGFDLSAVASQTVRTAVSYLTGDDGYGSMPPGVLTLVLREPDGTPSLPAWSAHDVGRHPDCGDHP